MSGRGVRSMRASLLAGAMMLLLGSGGATLAAEETYKQSGDCTKLESPRDCFDRLKEELVARLEEVPPEPAAEKREAREATKNATGADTSGASLESTTTDFSRWVSVLALIGQEPSRDEANNLVVDLNFLVPGLSKDPTFKLQAVLSSKLEIASEVKEKLPEDSRQEVVEKLEKQLGDLDDITYSLRWSPETAGFGRGFRAYRRLFESLYLSATSAIKASEAAQGRDGLLTEIADWQDLQCAGLGEELDGLQGDPTDLLAWPLDQLREALAALGSKAKDCPSAEALRADLERVIRNAAQRAAEAVAMRRTSLQETRLDQFGALVANQPQLIFTAAFRDRNELVGAAETRVGATYEWSRSNLNSVLSRQCRDRTVSAERLKEQSAGCLEEYRSKVDSIVAEIEDGERFSFTGEYVDIDSRSVTLESLAGTALSFPSAKKLVLGVGWSRYFAVGGGEEKARLDLAARYEDVSDDPERRDRGVATLTLTRKFNGIEVPLGIVYANHGEFLGEVDEQLSAHVGLKIGLDRKED